jgi:hypothetical protein
MMTNGDVAAAIEAAQSLGTLSIVVNVAGGGARLTLTASGA